MSGTGEVLYANCAASSIQNIEALFQNSGLLSFAGSAFEVVVRHDAREYILNAVSRGAIWYCYLSEITELRDSERKASYLASFPKNNPFPVIEFQLDGSLEYANPSAIKLVPDLFVKGLRDRRLTWIKRELKKSKNQPVSKSLEIGGRTYLATASLGPGAKSFRCYFVDISERKAAEAKLTKARIELIQRLTRAAEWRDNETGAHIKRMSAYCKVVAKKLNLPSEVVEIIELAASMHDIGKIGIPDAILHKPGKLTDQEFEVMKTHANIGANLLMDSDDPMLQLAREIALGHHEKWDGSGYPSGLKGTEIPISARIAAVCDVFDALTSDRPYKTAWSIEHALFELQGSTGKAFDPEVVDAFLLGLDEILDIRKKWCLIESLQSMKVA